MSTGKKIRVLVVDDSALARRAISEALKQDPELLVVGGAVDPYEAREKILELSPDVITLDLEMPRMDGLTFLKILMEHHPIPVVVVSSLTQAGSAKAMEALSLGAVDVLAKPDGSRSLGELAHQLAYHVKAAALSHRPKLKEEPVATASLALPPGTFSARQVILIGASTGGVEGLRYMLPKLPNGLPPIVVVQHIPKNFSRLMAERLNEVCPYDVAEAQQGQELHPGLCLIAPGDFHLALLPSGRGYKVRLTQTPPVHHCRPAVDILFRSGAEHAKDHAVAVLLTGMGVDGARGMLALHEVGATTLAEHEDSCIVYGMPQAAIKLNAVDRVVTLPHMASTILHALSHPKVK